MDIIPTIEQEELLDRLIKWYNHGKPSKPYYSYSGNGGTGKSTIIEMLIDRLNLEEYEYITVAYTGKASLNLLKKGLNSSTIHSLIYNVLYIKEPTSDPDVPTKTKLKFIKKESLSPELKIIIVDEATMVNDKMRDELLSFSVPIIFVGDMDQLPPVFGISSVMLNPDFRLTKIMRQAENDPIVQLSQSVLHDEPFYIGQYGKSRVIESYEVDRSLVTDYDIILCAKNATRDLLNSGIRHDVLNIHTNDPVLNDKLICRQNNWDLYLDGISMINGLIGYVRDINRARAYKGYFLINFQPDFMDKSFEDVELDLRYIRTNYTERKDYGLSKYNKFEFGYVVSVHLIQGSEYPNVLFIDEFFHDRELTKKLRYTAITRAKESITIVPARVIYKPRIWYFTTPNTTNNGGA